MSQRFFPCVGTRPQMSRITPIAQEKSVQSAYSADTMRANSELPVWI